MTPKIYFTLFALLVTIAELLPVNSIVDFSTIYLFCIRGDYLIHVLMFFPWAFFKSIFNFKTFNWLIIGTLLALFAEFIQLPVNYRTFNFTDLLANLLGVFLGSLVYWFLLGKRQDGSS